MEQSKENKGFRLEHWYKDEQIVHGQAYTSRTKRGIFRIVFAPHLPGYTLSYLPFNGKIKIQKTSYDTLKGAKNAAETWWKEINK